MHNTREQWLNAALLELRPVFGAFNFPLPEKIRLTCGFPSSRAKAKNAFIGEHWSPVASSDNTHEILISPVVDDQVEVLAVLVHELAHAATNGDGHGSHFTKCIRSLWLEGKPTTTVAGDAFKKNFAGLLESLGQYPHAKLNVDTRKKQSTRMIKACCPTCNYTIRLTKTWADKGLPICPIDGSQFI